MRALALLLASVASGAAPAADCVWNGGDGSWSLPANWSGCAQGDGTPTGTPGPSDAARIDAGNVSMAGTRSVAELELRTGARLHNVGAQITQLTVTDALRLAGGTLGNEITPGQGGQLRLTLPATAITTLTASSRIENFVEVSNSGVWNMDALAGNVLELGGGTIVRNLAGANFVVRGNAQLRRDGSQLSTRARLINFGTLRIEGPGQVDLVGFDSSTPVEIELETGELQVAQASLRFVGSGRASFGLPAAIDPPRVVLEDGTLDLGDPAATFRVERHAILRGRGSVLGQLQIDDGGLLDVGAVGGAPYGTVNVSGGFRLNGTLRLDRGGAGAGQQDLLVTAAALQTNSASAVVDVRFPPGVEPAMGEAFRVVGYATPPTPALLAGLTSNSVRKLAMRFTATGLDAVGAPRLLLGPASFVEGSAGTQTVQVPVRLSEPAPFATRVQVQGFTPGTAILGGPNPDYAVVPIPALDFAPGQTEVLAPVQIIGDAVVEGHEEFRMDFRVQGFVDVATGVVGVPRQPIRILSDELPAETRYVLLSHAGRLWRYATTGPFIDSWIYDAGHTTGICFDAAGSLIATRFDHLGSGLARFGRYGALLNDAFGGGAVTTGAPESCAYDRDGNVYVGHEGAAGEPDANVPVLKYAPSGQLLERYVLPTGATGTDQIELGADQCTLYYTSEDAIVRRYDLCTRTALPPLATLPETACYQPRRRPNGEVLVACSVAVHRLAPTGAVLMSYPRASFGESGTLYGLSLDPDNSSFWAVGITSHRVVRVSIADGSVLASFSAATQLGGGSNGGIAVYDQLSAVNGEGILRDGFESAP